MELPQRIGTWKVVRRLGAGGMGTVFEVADAEGETRALKLLNVRDETSTRRFQREYRALARLRHPNVVRVYDTGQYDQRPYFTMDLVAGQSLDEWLRGSASRDEEAITAVDSVDWSLVGGPLPVRTSPAGALESESLPPLSPAQMAVVNRSGRLRRVRLALTQVSRALAYVHEQRIVHRDLKPSNILVDSQGHLVLMDFGVAADEAEGLESGQVMGTYAYMSPEQVRGQDVDLRSDLYSLGVLLFEALAGRRPFEADSPAAAIYQHVFTPVPELHQVNPQAPRDLVQLAHALLGKQPSERPASAWDVLERLGEETPEARLRHPMIFRAAMVGREQQLGRFARWLERPGQGLVAVTGQSGMGKTRFLMEATEVARDQGYRSVFLGPGSDRSYGFVAPLLDLIFEAVDGTPLMARRLLRDDGSLLLRLDPRLGAIENFPIEQVPALPPDAERMRVRGALWRVLRRLARQEPVAIMVDGIAAADELASELLRFLMEQTDQDDDVPLVFVVVGDGDQDWGGLERLALALEPLDKEQVGLLAGEILGAPVAQSFAAQLEQQSQGSPLLVREVIRRWSDQRLLDRDESGLWVLAELPSAGEALQATADLRLLAKQDLAEIAPEQRELLLAVSVLGTHSSWSMLCRVLATTETEAQPLVEPLLDAEILREQDDRLVFRHQVHQSLVLEQSDESVRQTLHRHTAEALFSGEDPDPEGMVSHALAGGHSDLLEAFLPAAAQKARSLGDLARAQRHLERILDHARQEGRVLPLEVALSRAEVLRDRGDLPGALRAVDELLDGADASGQAYRALAMRFEILGDLGDGDACLAALPDLETALASAEGVGRSALLSAKAVILQRFGDARASLDAYTALESLARELEDQALLARAIQAQGICHERVGALGESARLLKLGIEAARVSGNEQVLMVALINAVPTVLLSGELEEASSLGQEAISLAQRMSNVRAGVIAAANGLWVEMELGALDGLDDKLRQLLDRLEQDGAPYAEPECRLLLARVLLSHGNRKEALLQAELGRDRAQSLHMERESLILEVLLQRMKGMDMAAEEMASGFEALRARATDYGAMGEVAWSWEQEGIVRRSIGDEPGAVSCFQEGLSLARKMGYELFARRCEEALKS